MGLTFLVTDLFKSSSIWLVGFSPKGTFFIPFLNLSGAMLAIELSTLLKQPIAELIAVYLNLVELGFVSWLILHIEQLLGNLINFIILEGSNV